MTSPVSEYLLRVKPHPDGGYTASLRQMAGQAHPDVRAVLGPVSHGRGANMHAAMVAAISQARIGQVREVPRNGC